jgi:hypothetical protein
VRNLIVLFLILLAASFSFAGVLDDLEDPVDGKLDLSDWLLSAYGFLPVPILITEPAVGFGLGLAAVFFHETRQKPGEEGQRGLPPSVSAAALAYTETDSWVAGGGHFGSWKNDTIRYTGGLGYADLNLNFFVLNRPFAYNIQGAFLLQEIKFRLGESPFFVGASYTYFDSKSRFKFLEDIPGVDPDDLDMSNAGLGVIGYLDSRDNILSPVKGHEADLTVTRFDTVFGGDNKYWDIHLQWESYHPLSSEWFFNWKLELETTDGDVPFYALPFVELRGIPALRYQGDSAASFEAEGRWQFVPRWSLVGFAGVGATEDTIKIIGTDGPVFAGGAGFRYLAARKLNLLTGIDIARGPEEWVFYIQVGSAWGR